MLSLDFADKEIVVIPFRKKEREIVGNDPLIDVYISDEDKNYNKAEPHNYMISVKESEIIVEFKSKKSGLIKVS